MQVVQATNTPSIRELGVNEIDSVNGSFLPLIVGAVKAAAATKTGKAVISTVAITVGFGAAEGAYDAAVGNPRDPD